MTDRFKDRIILLAESFTTALRISTFSSDVISGMKTDQLTSAGIREWDDVEIMKIYERVQRMYDHSTSRSSSQ
ncbi:hypothetical protein M378DRAFT_1013557 [Amanita muscaria Koide BX008]|uniref:Uncharacterized protein n=1 Tax=Amanita muscaria (strain Koide BX008) TaxID=946122 RepID=A0A0C2S939_AMAMK|nr:hypothetical protein M378DRAFT_1013557 [Amanita muscaria Koide BX008]